MMGWYHLLDKLLSIHAIMGEQVWWPIDVIYNHGFLIFQLEKKKLVFAGGHTIPVWQHLQSTGIVLFFFFSQTVHLFACRD